eukprot:815882-Prymnesium_polylepis.1
MLRVGGRQRAAAAVRATRCAMAAGMGAWGVRGRGVGARAHERESPHERARVRTCTQQRFLRRPPGISGMVTSTNHLSYIL